MYKEMHKLLKFLEYIIIERKINIFLDLSSPFSLFFPSKPSISN
jgi:hypothetical protein